MNTFEFAADLWQYTGTAARYFVTLPHEVADEIDEIAAEARRGFGGLH